MADRKPSHIPAASRAPGATQLQPSHMPNHLAAASGVPGGPSQFPQPSKAPNHLAVASRVPAASRAPGGPSHIGPSKLGAPGATGYPSASQKPHPGPSARPGPSAFLGHSQALPAYQTMAGPRGTMQGAGATMSTQLNRDHAPGGATAATNLQRDVRTAMKEPTVRQPTVIKGSLAPPNAKSFLTTPQDIKMATRQTAYKSLAPNDKAAQDQWAQDMITKIGACPEGFNWNRVDGGYQCQGGGHGITDEFLAEGLGGMWSLKTHDWNVKEGPYYPHPNKPGKFVFRGQ